LGSTAKPITRPEVKAGPIERKRSPLKVGVDRGSRGEGDSLGVGDALGLGEALGVGLVEGDGVGTGSWARTQSDRDKIRNNARAHLDIG
jgi:hypothetical protein